MIRDHFRVLVADLTTGRGTVVLEDGRDEVAGGSGLAARLFARYGRPEAPWDHPDQPLILAIGPLTGAFPLMSKTVFAFKSPYHDQYTESHAGGRSALALRFADLDALVVVGRAAATSFLDLGSRHFALRSAGFLAGMDVQESGRLLRRMTPGSGHRTILRIGPAGENLLPLANVNVDTYRHFGRMGGGAALGAKRLKAVVIRGDADFSLPEGRAYNDLFARVYTSVTASGMMKKYHDLGTPANLEALDEIRSLPWRNLQATSDPAIEQISGQEFADRTLLRNSACSGCPVGCIHVGYVRERFMDEHRFLYRQVAYDYEPIFAFGSMLGVTDTAAVLTLLDAAEQRGLDAMSAGVALAWAAEASERGILSTRETIVPLAFGESAGFLQAIHNLAGSATPFYASLGQGTLVAANEYGGADFACVLGQEMAGYATGETFFAAQSLGFRHSHLDTGAYGYDQKNGGQDVAAAVRFLVDDEAGRVVLTSMVACLFARSVYTDTVLAECLDVLDYRGLAANMASLGPRVQKLRWQTRLATGFAPAAVSIPKRFFKVSTWKGPIDSAYLDQLKEAYAQAILDLGSS
jgi:aldehyde:ferredoxin oxidoreductase